MERHRAAASLSPQVARHKALWRTIYLESILKVLFAGLLLLLLLGCTAQPGSPMPTPIVSTPFPITVTLDVFSGRPNPEWVLSAKDTDEVSKLLGLLSLASVPYEPEANQNLGYRGFILTIPDSTGATKTVFVYHETITEKTASAAKTYYDPNRSIEKFLLESAQGVIEPTLFTYMEGEIQK